MAAIVAGRYDSLTEAEDAARVFFSRGFSVWDVSVFSVGESGASGETGSDGLSGREPGVLLAVRIASERDQDAIDELVESGARDVERAEGNWEGGKWTDFDPAAAPRLVSVEQGEPWPQSQVAKQAVQPNETGNEDPGSEIEAFVEQQVSTDAGADRQ